MMDVEKFLANMLDWIDKWLSSPDAVAQAERIVHGVDLWLEAALHETNVPPVMPNVANPVGTAYPQSISTADATQPADTTWLPPKMRRGQSSTVGMK